MGRRAATVENSYHDVTYLRYVIRLRETGSISIFTPAGFLLNAGRMELSTARKIVRAHRAAGIAS